MLIDDKNLVLLDEVKITVRDFEKDIIVINFKCSTRIEFLSLADFEAFVKKLYTAYKKYKYILEVNKK